MKLKDDPTRTLTKKQKMFADEYIATGNGVKSVRKSYKIKDNDYNTAGAIASENLKKPNIMEYLKSNSQIAANVIIELVKNKKTPAAVRLNASKDILDRTGYKPMERVQEIIINLDVENMSTEDLMNIIKG